MIPCKCFEQMDALVEEAVPGFSFAVFKRTIAVCIPFFEKHSSTILLTKVSTQSFFKATTEDHRCPCLFFPPSIQIAVPLGEARTLLLNGSRAQTKLCQFRGSPQGSNPSHLPTGMLATGGSGILAKKRARIPIAATAEFNSNASL